MLISQNLMKNIEEKQWYVLQAMYGKAIKAEQLFNDKLIDSFVPMESKIELRKGKKSIIKRVPIISNLVFAYTTFTRIKELCAVHSYLYYRVQCNASRDPMSVPREQMQQFIDFVQTDGDEVVEKLEYINPDSFNLKKSELVRITKGPFMGKTGILVKVLGEHRKQIVVALDGLLAVTIKDPKPWTIIEKI